MTFDPRTDCAGFYDRWLASDIALSNGTSVASWTSYNSVTVAASGSVQPIYRTAGFQSLPSVEFDGIDDCLTLASPGDFLRNLSGFTLYVVCSLATNGTTLKPGIQITTGTSSTAPRGVLLHNSGRLEVRARSADTDSAKTTASATTETAGQARVVTGVVDVTNTTGTVYYNGTQRAQNTGLTFGAATTADTAPQQLTIGGDSPSGSGRFDGQIAEVWVFHAVHTTTDRARFHSYVQDKYGITVSDYTSSGTSANAGSGTVGATANAPTVSISGSASPSAGLASLTATANNPTISTVAATSASAENAAPSVTGYGPAVTAVPDAVPAPAGVSGGITLRLYNASGAFQTLLPTVGAVEVDSEFNAEGSGTLRYPSTGTGASTLTSLVDGYVGVWFEGVEVFTFLLEDNEDDEANVAGDARQVVIGGRGTLAILERGITIPPNGIGSVPTQTVYTNATPGKIMIDFITKMQANGCLTSVTTTFTASTDSSGNAWTKVIDISYDTGKDLLTIVKDLSAQGLCDIRMRGLTLDLYNPGTTLAIDRSSVYVRRPHATKAPRKKSTRELRTDYLVVGEEGVNTLRTDTASALTYGHWIGYIGQGNTTTQATLNTIGDQALAEHARPTRSYQLELIYEHPTCPRPFVDFFLGDYIRTDFAMDAVGAYEPMRVRAIAISWDADGTVGASLELNDRYLEAILDLKRRIEGVVHGTVTTVSGGPPQQPTPADSTIPNPPASVTVTTGLSVGPEGISYANANVSWTAVTTNTDGSAFSDFGGYRVRYRLPGISSTWAGFLTTTGTSAVFQDLPTGATFQAGVVAMDASNNLSNETLSTTVTLPVDSTPPPQPSTPTATASLGGVRLSWDGKDYTGATMPGDFKHVQIHMSTTNGFTPSSATLWDTLAGGAGVSWITGQTYNVALFFKLIAVDYTGNISTVSGQATATPTQVTGADIGAGQIGFNAIAFKDLGNLVHDGSFENPALDIQRTTDASFSYVTDAVNAPHGTRYVRNTGSTLSGTLRRLWLMDDMQVSGGERFWLRYRYRRSAGSNGEASVGMNATLSDNTTATVKLIASVADGTWKDVSTVLTLAVNARTVDAYIRIDTAVTTGTTDIDMVELRRVNPTELIDDAAITNAKIANLAVDDAKVANMSVGKLVAGTLTADVTVSARIKTADSGARAEMDSAGFKVYDGGGANLFSATGSGVSMLGQVTSAVSGRRVVVNPDPVNYLATIAFYPNSGSNFAYINTWIDSDGTLPGLGLNSGGDSTLSTAKQWTIRLQNDYYRVYRNAKNVNGTSIGPSFYMDMNLSDPTFNWVELQSAPSSSSDQSILRLMNQPSTGGVTVLGGAGNTFLTGSLFTSPGVNSTLFGNWVTFSNVGSGGTYTTISYGITHSRVPVPQLTPQADSGSAYMLGVTLRSRSSTGFGINTYPIRSADAGQDWIVHWLAVTTA